MRLLAVCLSLFYKMSHVTWTDLSLSLYCCEIGTETGVMNDLSEHLKYAKCPHFFAPFSTADVVRRGEERELQLNLHLIPRPTARPTARGAEEK